jgi:hypothetical protein
VQSAQQVFIRNTDLFPLPNPLPQAGEGTEAGFSIYADPFDPFQSIDVNVMISSAMSCQIHLFQQ